VENVYEIPLIGGRWRKAAKWPCDLVICRNAAAPMIPVQGKVRAVV
jgi:hypothetical protein